MTNLMAKKNTPKPKHLGTGDFGATKGKPGDTYTDPNLGVQIWDAQKQQWVFDYPQ
jgi:hypothetical protein